MGKIEEFTDHSKETSGEGDASVPVEPKQVDVVYTQPQERPQEIEPQHNAPDWLKPHLEIAKEEKACFSRAIGSAVGAEPTDLEYFWRFEDFVRIDALAERLAESDMPIPEAVKVLNRADRQAENDLLEEYERNNTSLGSALRNYDHSRLRLTPEGIERHISSGDSVCVQVMVPKPDGGEQGHTFDAGVDSQGIFSKSDEGVRMPLVPDVKYPTIVFTPKAKPQA